MKLDRFGIAIVIAAVTTAALSVLVVWFLTDGDWWLKILAALLAWAVCWFGMGVTSQWADEE